MNFEMSNTETYNKMVELSLNKQKHINPIVTKFLRLNMQFFKKTNKCFSELKSIDANSKSDYDKMLRESEQFGGKDAQLQRLQLFDKQDKEDRASSANFENDYDRYGGY